MAELSLTSQNYFLPLGYSLVKYIFSETYSSFFLCNSPFDDFYADVFLSCP